MWLIWKTKSGRSRDFQCSKSYLLIKFIFIYQNMTEEYSYAPGRARKIIMMRQFIKGQRSSKYKIISVLKASDIKFRSRKVYFYNKLLNYLFFHSDNSVILLGVKNVDNSKIIFLKYFHGTDHWNHLKTWKTDWTFEKIDDLVKTYSTFSSVVSFFLLL